MYAWVAKQNKTKGKEMISIKVRSIVTYQVQKFGSVMMATRGIMGDGKVIPAQGFALGAY